MIWPTTDDYRVTKGDHNLSSICLTTERTGIKTKEQSIEQQFLTMSSDREGKRDTFNVPSILILALYCNYLEKPVHWGQECLKK